MASVEDKIVAMKFDNKQFEPNAKTTMSTLDRLKAALNFKGTGNGLNELQNSANRFSLANVGNAAQGMASKFNALSVVAIAALASITAKAVDAGLRIAKALTIQPMTAGFQEYETGLNSVQTILANTAASGASLKDVNATLLELNQYADKTIYNFGEMARNIGTFTAAGVDLKTSAMSIKGIANLAALSGSNSQQASTAMYQLSQAISSGRVSLQDWNSVVNAGMGGTVFQRALATNAEKMGTLSKGAVELKGKMKNVSIEGKSFRESITAKPGEESWLTSKVLTETLKQFTGDMTAAELAAQGFNKSQIEDIMAMAKTAENAATEVKTFTQLMGTLQEAAGSGWAQTFGIVLGDFEEAKKLWTEVNNVVGGAIGDSAKARNDMLTEWKKMGGRTQVLDGIRNIFAALVSVVTPIKEAFREIFPATTAKQLFAMTTAFLAFTKTLKIGATTAANIKRTFAGVFAIFSIGWSLVKALAGVLGDLFGVVMSGSGSFLEVTASVGDWLVALDKAIKKGDVFGKFFGTLGTILAGVVSFVKEVAAAIGDMFEGFQVGGVSEALGRITDRLAPLAGAGGLVAKVWEGLINILGRAGEILAPLGAAIGTALGGIGDAIAEAFKAGDFNSVYDALNTGLLTGIVLLIKKFLGEGLKIDLGGGLGASIKETFGALTSTLSAMQAQIQAKTLMSIAVAIGILTLSIVALSLIDSGKLTKSLTAMGVAFGQLMVAMAILSKITAAGGFLKVPIIAAALIALSVAVLILTAAVRNLSGLSWEELAKGLIGVAALLTMLVGVARGLEKASGSMLRAGLAMIPLAIGIKILGSAVSDMSGMTWGEIAKGMTTIGAAIAILAIGLKFMTGSLAGSAALLIAAAALNVMVPALQAMGDLDWQSIGKIMVVLFGSLALLAAGMYAMTAALPGAAALIVAAAALRILTPALAAMGELDWGAIGKIMVVLFGTLLLLAAGLTAMIVALPGAAALTVAAAALAVLAPVLMLLGTMSWEMIIKGLVAIAGAFVVLGISGLLLLPVIPIIVLLSASLLALGVAMALIGVGALALATAFSIFVAAGTAGLAVIIGMINLIPMFMTKFAEGIGAFAVTITNQAGKFTRAFVSLLNSLLDAVIQVAPKIGRAFTVLMNTCLQVITANTPRIVAAGYKLIIALLNEISKNVPKIVKIGTDIVVKFMQGITKSQGRLLQAGARMIIEFINKLASTIRANQSDMESAGRNLAGAIIDGMTGGIWRGISSVARAARGVAREALAAAKSALGINSPSKEFMKIGSGINEGWAKGVDKTASMTTNAVNKVASSTIGAVKSTMSKISSAFGTSVDLDPTIRPVLDLTQMLKDAKQMNGVLGTPAISASVSYGQASGISNSSQARRDDTASANDAASQTILELTQNNYSPKALSPIEIYRNTQNQLSMAKEALGT